MIFLKNFYFKVGKNGCLFLLQPKRRRQPAKTHGVLMIKDQDMILQIFLEQG